MKNFGEEAYFKKQIVVVNRFDEWLNNLFPKEDEINEIENAPLSASSDQVKIELEKDSFKFREKIVCRVDFDSDQYKALAFSVKEMNYYSANPVVKKGGIPSSIPKDLEFAPERDGIFLTGKITDGNSNPLPDECLFLSTPDSVANLVYTFSDSSGRFSFFLNEYYAGKQLIIKPRNNSNGSLTIVVDDKFLIENVFEPVRFGVTRELRTLIQESQNLVRIQKAYGINRTRVLPGKVFRQGLSHVYRQAGTTVFPSDFVALTGFKQISENLLSGTRLRTDGENYQLYLLNKSNSSFFQQPAAIFLDGVYVYGLKQSINLNSEAVSRIELCYNQRIKGAIDFPGILSIHTVGKTKDFSFDAGSCIVNMPGFTGNSLYASPNYNFSPVNDPVPDLRQLIYWSPFVEKQHEFFASDWSSDYVIEVEMVNQSGEIEIFRKNFKVGK
jgi:hypothetical protein